MMVTIEGIKLCIFDPTRGQHEGQELDKILFFFPTDCPYTEQLSVIGLSEGLITFTRIFSPEAACEFIEADKHSHTFYQAEPDVWMIMILEKTKETDPVGRSEDLRAILKEIHSLFTTFNGSLRSLLEKQPSGELARSYLYSFVIDYLNDFHVGKKYQIPSFRDCLKERGTVQVLTVSREVAIELQSLMTVLSCSCGPNVACKSLILFENLLVSTTLSPEDTVNIFTYAVMRLTPQALSSGSSSWSYSRLASTAPYLALGATIENIGFAPDGSVLQNAQAGRDTSIGGQSTRSHVPRPLQRDKWSKGKDGFLETDIWGREVGNITPVIPSVWLQQIKERMYLLVNQHKGMTIVLLVPVFSLLNSEQGLTLVKQQVLENESLLSLNKLREDVDLEKNRARMENPEHEKDLEVCIRAKNNAWTIAKLNRGRELLMVLEKASETLMYATEAVEKFSNRYCEGAFSLD